MTAPWPFGPLRPLAGYDVIVAGPPLDFELYSARGDGKSYQRRHGALPLAEIKALPVGHLARNPSLLLLPTAKTMLDIGLGIMSAWGFTFKSEIVCRKLTVRGKPFRGTGYRVIDMHLSILLGTIGSPVHKPFPSHFEGRVRRDGGYPHELFELVEDRCPKAWMVELFAPGPRRGWDSWVLAPGQFEPVVHEGAAPVHKNLLPLHGPAEAAA